MSAFDPIRAVLSDPTLLSQLDDLETSYDALAERYTQLQADLAVLRDQRRDLKARLDAMPTRVALEKKVKDLEAALAETSAAYVTSVGRVNVLESRIRDLRARNRNFESLLDDVAAALGLAPGYLNVDILDAIAELKAPAPPTP